MDRPLFASAIARRNAISSEENNKMSKLRAIAERLRSDNENERLSAVNLIERNTGLMIADIIRMGSPYHLSGAILRNVLTHIDAKRGDQMILAVGSAIASLNNVTWPDIIESGSLQSAGAAHSGSSNARSSGPRGEWPTPKFDTSEAWTAAFNNFMAAAGENLWEGVRTDPPLSKADIQDIYDSVLKARSEMKRSFTRVSREDLPPVATGTPHVKRKGTSKNGEAYAIVSFIRMTAMGDELIAPMCEFIAFGKDWIEMIEKADESEGTVSVTFGEDRSPNKNVVIKNAV